MALKLPKLSRKTLLVLGGFLLLAAGGGGYTWYQRRQAEKFPTVVVNGKEIPAPFKTKDFQPTSTGTEVDPAQDVKLWEDKIAAGGASYKDYLALAQAYVSAGDNKKAIENYEKAKQTADPNMRDYQSFIESTDNAIKELQGTD